MGRTAAFVVTTIIGISTLSACGGDSSYCDAVEKDTSTLNTFGQKRTDAAYAGYAKVFDGVAKVAPTTIKQDWKQLADVTKGVIAAQNDVGLSLEEMDDTDKVKKLDETELAELNKAYKTFNGTTAQRRAVVKNVLQECDIKLK